MNGNPYPVAGETAADFVLRYLDYLAPATLPDDDRDAEVAVCHAAMRPRPDVVEELNR